MRAVEFCYWLQGAFELAQIGLTAEQIICVQKHLALVEATPQTGQPKQATDFCSWLRNGLDFISPGDARQVQAIRTKLNDCFEHELQTAETKAKAGTAKPRQTLREMRAAMGRSHGLHVARRTGYGGI